MGVQSVTGSEMPNYGMSLPSQARTPRSLQGAEGAPAPKSSSPPPPAAEPDASTSAQQMALFLQEKPDYAMVTHSTRLSVDPATDRIVAQIVDANNEVVRQVPPEELLQILAKSREIQGLLFNRKA